MTSWGGEGTPKRISRLLGDATIAVLAFAGAFLARIYLPIPFTRSLLPEERLLVLLEEWGPVLAAQLAGLYLFGLYDPPRPRERSELARRLAVAVGTVGLILMGYYFLANQVFPRSVLVLYLILDFFLLLAWRLILDRPAGRHERWVAIVGCGETARELAEALRLHAGHGLRVAGFIPRPGEAPPAGGVDEILGPCLGSAGDLPGLLASGRVEDVILAGSDDSWESRLLDSLAGTRPAHTNVLLLPGPFESLIGRMRYRWVHDLPLVEVVRESEWRINWPLKRVLDMAGGMVLLLLSVPVLAACALAVRATSPGPVLYRQVRVGRGHKLFTLLKLRTMREDAEADSGEILAQPDDPRLTSIGAFLRRFRLDEIPQLLNVLEGSMSLVGPRPERPGFVQRYLQEVPGYAERFSIAPGLTGLAQVNGDYHSSPQNKLRYELAYLANWSIRLDVSILLRTVKIVLTSRGV